MLVRRFAALTVLPVAALAFAAGCATIPQVTVNPGTSATGGSDDIPSEGSSAKKTSTGSGTKTGSGAGGGGGGESTPAKASGGILDGKRLVEIGVNGGPDEILAIGHDDDDTIGPYPRTGSAIEERGRWIIKPAGSKYQIMLGTLHGDSKVCMEVVHDGGNGTVRDRVCDTGNGNQLFTIKKETSIDGAWSLFNGKRYVQVVDGGGLVPDLPEGLTTTYTFKDAGTPDPVFTSGS
jgi:hypothetical protein